jgi:hypothetical protein
MLCRTCGESIEKDEEQPEQPERRRSRSRRAPASAQLCSRCGELLGHEELELRAQRKKSQLAKFGLAGKRRPLLQRKENG